MLRNLEVMEKWIIIMGVGILLLSNFTNNTKPKITKSEESADVKI